MLVGGAPASGKTTLTRVLARELCLPLLTKDLVKEALFDTLGSGDRQRSRELSLAAYAVLYAIVTRLLEAGTSVILEANFHRGTSEAEIRPLLALAHAGQIFCRAALDETVRRYDERVTGKANRHPGHRDAEIAADVESWFAPGSYDALDLHIPILRVDTTQGYHPEIAEILAWVASLSS